MRASKPCLVSDVPGSGMSWVVQDNQTGFVVKHNNVDSLVDKLKYISANRDLLGKYGKAGRKRFDDVFSIKAVSREVMSLYEEVLKPN
jgi:rhamnosyl/mannosyltransferase